MASLGSLVIELAANTARLQSDLGKAVNLAQGAASKFSSIFKGVAVLTGAGSLGAVVARSIEVGDSLNKAAIKAGTTGRAMSELAYAAKQSDIDLSSLSNALKKMQVALSEAASGGKTQNETLKALGVSIGEIKGLSADKQFELLADRINKLKDPSDRARAAVELFGKAGADLLPLFEQGAEGIRKAREEAQRMGASFSEEQIKKLATADDAIKRLKGSWEAFAATLTAKVAPAVSSVLNNLAGAISGDRVNQLEQQINFLEKVKGESFLALGASTFKDIGSGFFTAEEGARKLAELRRKLNILRGVPSGHRGGDRGFAGTAEDPVGFAAVADIEKQDAAYKSLSDSIVEYARDANRVVQQQFSELDGTVEQGVQDAFEASERRDRYFQESLEHYNKLYKRNADEMSEYAKRAAQNMQDAFANFLFDPFHDGLKGMLKSFTDTIRRMIAEAAAAKIFGSKKSGGLGLGDFITKGVDALFGGFKAEGGPLQQGKWYVAGEHGPEPVWGGGPGAFATGYGKGGGGLTVNIDARGATEDGAKRLERYIPAIIQQAAQQAHVMTLNTFSRS